MHLFVDISSHGFGHFAITAPVLNALADFVPNLRLTVRSGLPAAKLAQRIRPPFAHLQAASDFGYVMHNALSIDMDATARAYRIAHADWPGRVRQEADFLAALKPDAVLANVSCLPIAGAAACGIPALAICSLNWADLFAHFFGGQPWALPIHAEMLAAYRSARHFIRITPAMPMAELANTFDGGPGRQPGPAARPRVEWRQGRTGCAGRHRSPATGRSLAAPAGHPLAGGRALAVHPSRRHRL